MAKKNITRNFSPGSMMTSSVLDLHSGELKLVQNYVKAGINLPYSYDQMMKKWNMSEEEAKSYENIKDIFARIHLHCDDFETHTYPDSVHLAADIVHYRDKATKYFKSIIKVADRYDQGSYSEEKSTRLLTKYLTKLLNMSRDFSKAANEVCQDMTQFVKYSKEDKNLLDPIKELYEKKYESEDGIIATLNKKLDELHKVLEKAQKEYEDDVKVAATTPTYAWVLPFFPVGLVAAAVVAGIYGKRAVDALDDIHRNMKEISEKNEEVNKAQKLMTNLHMANTSLEGISTKLDRAIPVMDKIKGAWDTIASDLEEVLKTVQDEDIADLDMVEAEASSAIDQWNRVAYVAYNYQKTAYMEEEDYMKVKSRVDAEQAYSPYADVDPDMKQVMQDIEKEIEEEER